MKIVWIGLLVACFELVVAGDKALEVGVASSTTSDRDVWVNGKIIRKGDSFLDHERTQELIEAGLEQRQIEEREKEQAKNRVAEDSEKQQKDLAILTSSYGDLIKNRWHALVWLLSCASGQEQPDPTRLQVHYSVTAQPELRCCYPCKQDPLCILNCCCCCLGVIGFCTAQCRSNE